MKYIPLCSLFLLAPLAPLSTARADVILDIHTYVGCYADAHVSVCITVPYTLTTSIVPGVNLTNGGPITYNILSLGPNTEFIPIYQVFPMGYLQVGSIDNSHIGPPVGFEQDRTLFTTLPLTLAIRFAEVVDCPFTGIYQVPPCGVGADPAFSQLHNDYVSDISVPLTATPEPSTLALAAIGLLTLTLTRTKRK